ncbi:DNA damage-inducible protein D [Flavobacterium sp. ASV13]|uniref:DNA damage-inducible protein D n=1 Tax=Flavobacterium sp. ASV13 TaxID=1506583 RepID=UPI00054D1D9A|nr:DNA damage-inducible protein D [Flavobacterium sp. ASV13]
MKTKKSPKRSISVFDKMRRFDKAGNEFWSSKELAGQLGYADFKLFLPVIKKAETACRNAGQKQEHHFKEIAVKKTQKNGAFESEDINLSRYACYLVIQNSDPALKPVAIAQTYLATQTRFAEISALQRQNSLKIVKKRRVFLRNELSKYNLQLAGAARQAGIIKPKDYALFQNHGYRGLYGGLDVKAIRELRELDPDENILDHMDSAELAVNLLRVKQTAELLNNDKANDNVDANSIHFAVGSKIRRAIEKTGETLPENLPVIEKVILPKVKGKELTSKKSTKK